MKRKPVSEYAWCVAHEDFGCIFPSFAKTRREAKERFENHAGMTLKTLHCYHVVKVYIATAKG